MLNFEIDILICGHIWRRYVPHQFFKMLSDETRVRIIRMIALEECLCVAELVVALQKVSRKCRDT